MVLYGEINRKGFEGDLVLNGYAEFIRNLLVCKDEKAAGLLEVVENFRDKYISAAKNVSPAFLISALNILNDAEINYKAARNKKLHVELALIKLCYLQQALEVTTNAESGVSKKKRVDSARALPFRQLIPVEVTQKAGSRKSLASNLQKNTEAKLIIESDTLAPSQPTAVERALPIAPAGGKKISALDKIRKQYQG